MRAPDLAAFDLRLLGGRLLPGVSGPSALFMYESGSGERFTLYCSRLAEQRTSLRYSETGNVAAIHWGDGGYGWVVSGPADKSRLKAVARAAYEQVENRAPPPQQPLVGRPADLAAGVVSAAAAYPKSLRGS